MKKKVGVMLAAGVMACSVLATAGLSGCGDSKIYEFSMPAGGYDGSSVTITFMNTTGQDLDNVIQAAIPRFNELYPNITVEVNNTTKDWDDLADKIDTQITSGKQPNLAFCYSDHVANYNRAGAVVALDQFFLHDSGYGNIMVTPENGQPEPLALTDNQEKDYIKSFWEDGWVYKDGHMYTLPLAKSTEVLFYNRDAFIRFGIVDERGEPKPPATWTEFEEVAAILREKDPSCISLGYDSEANLFITLCEQLGLDYTDLDYQHHYLFNTPQHKAVVDKLLKWKEAGWLTTKAVSGSNTSNLFKKTGANETKCYMSIGSTGGSKYNLPDSTDGQAAFEVGVAPIPQAFTADESYKNTDKKNAFKDIYDATADAEKYEENESLYKYGYTPKTILQGPNLCIFKKKNPQEVIASWLLVKFLTTDPESQGQYSEASGYSPVTESVFNSEPYQDFIKEGSLMGKVANVCYGYSRTNAFYTSPAFIGSKYARKQVGFIVEYVLKGDKTIDKAFADAIAVCNKFKDR